MCDVTKGNQNDGYDVAYCQDKECFIPKDDERNSVCICKDMERIPGFPKRGSRAARKCEGKWWEWGCCLFTSGYTWKDGKCQDKTRFINERCWDGGECKNGDGDARVSCYDNRCMPSVSVQNRAKCECDLIGWYFFFACSSSDTCDGHACVFSTGPGGWMCDYNTDQNW